MRTPIYRMSCFVLLFSCLSSSLAVAQGAKDDWVESDRILLTVHDRVITELDVKERLLLSASFRGLLQSNDPRAIQQREQLKRSTISNLVQEALLRHEAKRLKITLDEYDKDELEAFLKRRAEPYGGLIGLKTELAKRGTSVSALRKAEEAHLLTGKVFFEVVSKNQFVTPTKIRDLYELAPRAYYRKARTHVRRIRLTLYEEDLTEAAKGWLKQNRLEWGPKACQQLAQYLRNEITQGKDAGRLAAQYSMSFGDRDTNGLFRFETDEKEYASVSDVKSFEQVVPKLREGEVAPVQPYTRRKQIRGYDVIVLELRRKRRRESFQRAQSRITRQLKSKEFRVQVTEYMRKLEREAVKNKQIKNFTRQNSTS